MFNNYINYEFSINIIYKIQFLNHGKEGSYT